MPTVPDGQESGSRAAGKRFAGVDALTPSQARALSRSAPLTPEQFKQQGRQTQRRSAPMHVVLDDVAGRFAARRRDI